MTTIPFPRPGGMTASAQVEVTTPAAAPPAPPHQEEPSAAPRRSASAVPSITGLRIAPPGSKATLVDISASGLLAEWGVALRIGQLVTVDFEGTFSPSSLVAHVVRSAVASMTPEGVRYHVGLTFTVPIVFEDVPAEVADPPEPDDIENCW